MATKCVVVCTEYRGIFVGWTDNDRGDTVDLTDGVMVIRWGTTKGVVQLSSTGPTELTFISLSAKLQLRKVSAVFTCSPAAEELWKTAIAKQQPSI